MASTIRVTTKTLKSKAEELRTLSQRFKSEVDGLNESETRLAGMWEGEAQKAFHQQFQIDREKFVVFHEGINKYVERLIATADAYDKAEAENVSTAQTRKA